MSFGPKGMVVGGGWAGCGGVSMAGRGKTTVAALVGSATLVDGWVAAARMGAVLTLRRWKCDPVCLGY